MERIVTIILVLLVFIIGVVVIGKIIEGQKELPNASIGFECKLKGGFCTSEPCLDNEDLLDCGEGEVCCVEAR